MSKNMSLEKVIDRCFDRCNLIGEDVDIIKEMWRYKAIRELSDEEQNRIYDDIAFRLGFCR